jgi:transcriptional regulator with XRE-family HTH domain
VARQRIVERTLSERLAQARREMGVREWRDVRRAEIAEAVGVDPSMVTLYERGSVPSEAVLAKLARFFGTTPAYLRYGVVEPVAASAEGPPTAGKPTPARKANGGAS